MLCPGLPACINELQDSMVQAQLVPHLGLEVHRCGKYLVHCDHQLRPFCVMVEVVGPEEVAVWFGQHKYHTTLRHLQAAYENGLDQSTMVTFSVETTCPTPHHKILLELHAF